MANGWVVGDNAILPDQTSTHETFVFLGCNDQSPLTAEDGIFQAITIGTVEVLYCSSLDAKDGTSHHSSIVKYHGCPRFKQVYEKNALLVNSLTCDDNGVLKDGVGSSHARYFMYGEVRQPRTHKVPFYEQDNVWKFHPAIALDDPHLLIGNNLTVKSFVKDVCGRLVKSSKNLFPRIEQVKFGVIDTIGHGHHQLTHCDNSKVLKRDSQHKSCFVGHIPLSDEGLFLRIEEPADPVSFLLGSSETNSPMKDFCAVKNIYYVHVPKNAALFISEKTWHGGHYGSALNPRFHMVVCPRDGTWFEDDNEDALLILKREVIHNLNTYNQANASSFKAFFPDYTVKPNLINDMCKHIGGQFENTVEHKTDPVFADFLNKFYQMEIGK